MKARIILNEIRQDRESGLSSIGIGSTSMSKAFSEACKLDTKLKNTLPLSSIHWVFNDGMREFKQIISKILDAPIEKIGIQENIDLSPLVKEYFNSLTFPEGIEERDERRAEEFKLHWSSSRVTEMRIYKNTKMGVAYVTYIHDSSRRMYYYCFRMS
jgi:hypothetical protein